MKYLLGLIMLCSWGNVAKAQNIFNNTDCPMTVSIICYDPNSGPCPAAVTTPGNSMVTFADPPGPAHTYTVQITATIPAHSMTFFPPQPPCGPGLVQAYMICNDNKVIPWCQMDGGFPPGTPPPAFNTCGIIEPNPIPGTSCYTNHGYLPSDCPGCAFHPGSGHVCICFDPSGDLILGY